MLDPSRPEAASDEVIRWGILGTGKIARIVAGAIASSRDGILVRVGSRDGERARSFASEVQATHHGGYDDVIADPAVDIAYVAIPHPFHRERAIGAAEAGKHVLCEKPIAV